MITLHLDGQSEKLAPENPWSLRPHPLYHQWRTAVALQDANTYLIVNSHNTGTGKTRATLLHLFEINGKNEDVLFIVPTNALLHQHEEDTRDFVEQHELNFQVIAITAATVRDFRRRLLEQGSYQQMRTGETLFRLIRNYREFYPDEHERHGIIFVINPDIFYYALMFQYQGHDQRNLFQGFLTRFNYIIIDEFHYYDQKQFAFFLFFFSISKKMGYFDQTGRKICLLSATPNHHVIRFFDHLFGDNWQHISQENEPLESQAYERVATLAPLTLVLTTDSINDWGTDNSAQLLQWLLRDKQDGAIISNSLQRINRLHTFLLSCGLSDKTMRRITGPESQEARQEATKKPLILATPTVDIGYNFQKEHKQRQNIDFLICEAYFGDDLVQRIGRAGRILGKEQRNITSQAVALISTTALDALRPYDGQMLNRGQFKEIIRDNEDVLPHKHNLTGYIRTWAITEIFYPIYQVHRRLMIEEEKSLVEELYEELRDLFGVRGGSFDSLRYYFRKYYYRQQWLRETREIIPHTLATAEHVADWLKYRGEGEYAACDILPYLGDDAVLAHAQQQDTLRQFVQGQVYLTSSLFNFRDSFQGPTAVFYDPDRLLSSEAINCYDLFHVVASFHVQWLDGRSEFVQLCGETQLEGSFYGILRSHRDVLLTLEFLLQPDEREADFRQAWEGRPVALSGFKLIARERGSDIVPIDHRLTNALGAQFLTVLLISPDMQGWVHHALKNSPFYSRKLTIDFPYRQGVSYRAYLGKSAWLAYPELQTAFRIRQRMKPEAIII